MAVLITYVERRFTDLDALGHVSNIVFLEYCLEARLRILLQLGDADVLNMRQVVAHQSIDYRRPILYSTEPVKIEVWLTSVGNTSYRMKYRIIDTDGELSAEAETVMVCFDDGKAVPIPSGLRAALEAIVELEQ
jgi:acyl-CoA thioester hydrolase